MNIRFSLNGQPLNAADEAALQSHLPTILENIKNEFAKQMTERENEKMPYGDTGKIVYPMGKPFDFETISTISIRPIAGTKFRKAHLNVTLMHDTEQSVEMKIADPRN